MHSPTHIPSSSIRSSCHYYSQPSHHHHPPLIGSWIDWALTFIISSYICQPCSTPVHHPKRVANYCIIGVAHHPHHRAEHESHINGWWWAQNPNHRSFRRRAGLIDRLISAFCRSIYDPNCCVRHTLADATQEPQEHPAGHPAIDFDLFDEVDQSRRNNIMYLSQSLSPLSNLWPTPTHSNPPLPLSAQSPLWVLLHTNSWWAWFEWRWWSAQIRISADKRTGMPIN